MAECRAGEFSDQANVEDYRRESRDFVKTGGLQRHELGEPVRDLKGGGGDGACTLHAESGSCPFPALPRPLNFPSGCTCRCRCQCPLPNCPPVICPPRPVESCVPGLHQQYRDFYPECKETHLPIAPRTCAENDDLYLPSSPPPVMSLPPTPPPTQRCYCCQCPQTFVQEVVDPCPPPKPLGCPAKVDHGCNSPLTPTLFSFPDEVKARCFPTPPKCPRSSDQVEPCPPPQPCPLSKCFPDEIKSRCFPTSPKCPPSLGQVIPCPSSKCLSELVEPCCFPSPPRCPTWQERVDPSSRTSPPLKRITLPCLPGFPSRPPSPKGSYPPPPPEHAPQADTYCFPISPRRPKSPSLSFPKQVALAAQVNPCCHLPFPNPAPVDVTVLNTLPEPADVSEKPCSKSLKPVQRIYVCLPYPANPLPTSPKPLPSDDERIPPHLTICSDKIPPPPCHECIISQVPSPGSPKFKLPPSRSVSPTRPIISFSPGIGHLVTSSCQYCPRVDTERPKVLMSQKIGPSSPRVISILPECVQLDRSRPVSPSVSRAVLRPETAPTAGRHMECTCQRPDHKKRNQFYNASQLKTRSQSPSQSGNSTARHRRTENANITKFLNDVKRVLKNDFPPRIRHSDLKQDLKRDFYLSVKPELPFKDFSDRNRELPSSGRTTDREHVDFLSSVRSTLKPGIPSSSSGRTTDRKQDRRQEFNSQGTYCNHEDFLSGLPPKEARQENFMTERGTSPIIVVERTNNLFTNAPGMAPNNNNRSAHDKTDLLQSGHDHLDAMTNNNRHLAQDKTILLKGGHDHMDAMEEPSTCNTENSTETSSKNCRYGNNLVPRGAPKCANYVHPCSCEMCSYPFPRRQIPENISSWQSRRQKERHPSPRALLKSFNSYLNSQYYRHSKTPQRRPHRDWQSPPETPEQKHCSQRSKRSVSMRQAPRGLQQAPWGTHPILMCSRPAHSRFCMDPAPRPRLMPGPQRGCCCPRCAHGKF